MATRPEPKLTYEDYVRFPDDGRRRQIINGEVFVVPSPSTRHQEIVGRLHRLIANHVEARGGGRAFVAPLDVVLSMTDVVQPDVLFVSDADDSPSLMDAFSGSDHEHATVCAC
ncbi:MAG: Uma2 family endonuclease [Acidobacteria bacterium]|nr:Uma2 family endonuclease [Acidobacteriota bacterium]